MIEWSIGHRATVQKLFRAMSRARGQIESRVDSVALGRWSCITRSLFYRVGPVLDVGEENVPEDRHTVHVEDPELRGHEEEVEGLAGRPDEPVEEVDGGELVEELPPGLGEPP